MSSWQWPDLSEIKRLRKAADLTQKKLSDMSGVQQSMISRIEEGKVLDPSFATVRKLFQTLHSTSSHLGQRRLRARDVMNKKVISISPHQTAGEAWDRMKMHDFSQLPVIDEHGRIHGSVTMQSLPDVLGKRELASTGIRHIIGDAFPIVGQDTAIETLSCLLRLNPAVLVMEAGRIVGIVTKYDLLDALYYSDSG